jgi:hypothetical protein
MGGYIGFLIHSLIQKIFRHCHKDGIMFWQHFGVNTHTYIVEIRFGIINLLKLIKYDSLLNEIKSFYFFHINVQITNLICLFVNKISFLKFDIFPLLSMATIPTSWMFILESIFWHFFQQLKFQNSRF